MLAGVAALFNIKKRIVEVLVGHPIVASDELISWTPQHIRNGEILHDRAMHGFLSLEDRMRIKRQADKYKFIKGQTFVINFNSIIGSWLGGSSNLNANYTDTGGSARATVAPNGVSNIIDTTAASGTSTYGLVVGSSSTAVARTNTALGTQIVAGATASTLLHGVSSVAAITNPSGTITRTQLQRTFTGNPSSTVNIQEDGIYVLTGTSNWKFLFYRNINSFGAVANAQVVTLTINVDTTS